MTSFGYFYGVITIISDVRLEPDERMGCYKLMTS